ncbi:MAG: arylsulfotransferase family protein [Myxococcota bacterium]
MVGLGWIALAIVAQPQAGGSDDTLRSLEALGYVDAAPTDNPEERGVVRLEAGAFDGFNLLSSRTRANAHLLDMRGKILHTWKDTNRAAWMHVELQPNGDIIALAKDRHLVRLDSNSKVRWRLKTRAHHDFTVADDGRILLVARKVSTKTVYDRRVPVLEDFLFWLKPDGTIESEHSIFDRVAPLVSEGRIKRLARSVSKGVSTQKLTTPEYLGDLTHTNSVEILRHDVAGVAPVGSILLSIRELSRIVILDASLSKVIWSWGGAQLQEQHHATQLDNGHFMIFDNGVQRKRSRVIELDASQGKIVWEYTSPNLFTRLRGAAQKLPNGNVLLTESDSGHALEVTMEHNVVWEFWNPEVRVRKGRKAERDAIYRLLRYPKDYAANIK